MSKSGLPRGVRKYIRRQKAAIRGTAEREKWNETRVLSAWTTLMARVDLMARHHRKADFDERPIARFTRPRRLVREEEPVMRLDLDGVSAKDIKAAAHNNLRGGAGSLLGDINPMRYRTTALGNPGAEQTQSIQPDRPFVSRFSDVMAKYDEDLLDPYKKSPFRGNR